MSQHVVYSLRAKLTDSRVLTGFLLLFSTLMFLVPIFFITNPYTVVLPTALFAAGLLSVGYHLTEATSTPISNSIDLFNTKLLYIVWFMLIAASTILYYNQGYSRTITIHGFLLVLYVIPAILMFATQRPYRALGLLIPAGIFHRALVYFASPVPYGNDTHVHYGYTNLIQELGTLEPLQGNKNLYSPFFHIEGAISSSVLDIPVRNGAIFLVIGASITVVTTLLVYYLTAHYWNEVVGALSATLFITSDRLVGDFLALSGTTQLGLLFFVLAVYGTIYYLETDSIRHFVLFLIAGVALTFTHQATTFVTVSTVVGGMCIVALLNGYKRRVMNLSLVIGGVMFSDWIITTLGERSFLDYILTNLVAVISGFGLFGSGSGGGEVNISQFGYVVASPMNSTGYIHILPVGMLFFFASFGILYWLRRRKRSAVTIVGFIGGGLTVLLVLIFAGSVLNLPLVPSRWFMHLYVLLTVPAGVGLFGIINLIPQKTRSSAVLLCGLFLLTVPYIALMGANHISGIDDPVLDDAPGAERLSFTESEVKTIEHSMQFAEDGTAVYSDQAHNTILRYYIDVSVRHRTIAFRLNEGRLMPKKSEPQLVVSRDYMSSGHTRFNILNSGNKIKATGEVPINITVLGQAKVYHSENDCQGNQCGIYEIKY